MPRSRLFAADAERDAAAAGLREHYAAGRLDLDELEARIGRVYRARTRGQIDRAFAQLPETAARRRALVALYALAVFVLVARVAWFVARRVLWPLVRLAARRAFRRLVPQRPHVAVRP